MTKMNDQPRMAKAHQRQLNRLRDLQASMPKGPVSVTRTSTVKTSQEAFGGYLMLARTEQQVRLFVQANPEATALFIQRASAFGGFAASHPPDTMSATGEADRPFFILGWVEGGDPMANK